MIFCIHWDLVFEVRVANGSTMSPLPLSGPGHKDVKVPAPTARVSPMTMPLSGQDSSGRGDGRHSHCDLCRLLENARENVSSEKTTDFSFDLKMCTIRDRHNVGKPSFTRFLDFLPLHFMAKENDIFLW